MTSEQQIKTISEQQLLNNKTNQETFKWIELGEQMMGSRCNY